MLTTEYVRHDALALAGLLRSGAVSPSELMECALQRADVVQPRLNVLCHERYSEARTLAAGASVEGVFGAVPFLLKDSALASTSFPTNIGSRLFSGTTFKYDATLVERFRAAGLIPFARTTVPELCMAPTTEPLANQEPTRNPWDLTRSAGGSSGGAAAAVAAGIVPVAHANDGGGSIRIPASCCGVYGLKPSRGRVPMGPARGEGWGGLAVEGVVSRSVRDTAAALDAIGGDEPGAPYAAPPAPVSYLELLDRPLERPLRIAKWAEPFNGIPLAPECRQAVDHAEQVLRRAGHEVTASSPPDVDYDALVRAHIDVLAANVFASVHPVAAARPVGAWEHLLEPAIFDAYDMGKSLSAASYVAAINLFHSIGRRMARYQRGFDLVLTPTLAQLPVRLGEISTATDFRTFREQVARHTCFLTVVNASGQPAASVPCHWTANGLPVGVQLIGHFGREDQVLVASRDLEALEPWMHRVALT